MSNHRLPPMTALSQCPEIEKENYTTTNVDSVATPLAGISPYSFHQSPNATMKTRGKDGSNCSTEAGTSEDDDDDEPSDRQTIMSVSSSPLHNVQSSPRSSNLSTLTGGTNTRVFGMRQEFASSTTYQRSPTTPSIAKQKASLPGKQQYHYVHFLQRCSPTDSSSNSGVCSTSKSVVRYRQHEVTPSSTSLKKSCTCHHRTCNVVNKTRKDHALVKMESRRSSLPKPFSPLSSSMSEGQTKLFSRSETLILFDWYAARSSMRSNSSWYFACIPSSGMIRFFHLHGWQDVN